MPLRKFRLAAVAVETPEVRTFRFEPVDEPFTFKAGQFVLVRIGGEARAYSISSQASEQSYIELTIRIAHESYFPKKIAALKIGDIVEIDGPHGTFILGAAPEAVFIGAGVGIAGLRSLWTEFLKRNGRATIIYSSRTESELIWRKEFEAMQNAKTVFTLTRERPSGWHGETGRIDAALLKRHISSPARKDYYICGPSEMVESCKQSLLELGIPAERVKAESWGGIPSSA